MKSPLVAPCERILSDHMEAAGKEKERWMRVRMTEEAQFRTFTSFITERIGCEKAFVYGP